MKQIYYVVGHGVFVTKPFKAGDFVAEYCGDLIDCEEGDRLLDQTFVYYFQLKSNKYWFV